MHGIDCSVPFFFTHVPGLRIPVTPQLVVDVLRVFRIEFLDYPSCECLQTVSKDELIAAFCKWPCDWVSISLLQVGLLLKVLDS